MSLARSAVVPGHRLGGWRVLGPWGDTRVLARAENASGREALLATFPVDPALAGEGSLATTLGLEAEGLPPLLDHGIDAGLAYAVYEAPLHEEARQRLDAFLVQAAESASVDRRAVDPDDAGDARLGSTVGGKYRILARLGVGGMGVVYRAAAEDGAQVAVKVIKAERLGVGREALRRFVREARASTAISSPHAVRILDVGQDAETDTPYLVMELLLGDDLARHLRAGPLAPATACRVMAEACAGLAAAHARGIVHRDVKPANVFVHRGERGLIVKICDFGIAKLERGIHAAATDLTASAHILGSPSYMSPEQVRNPRDVDARSDVWSVGVTLHQALSGRHPWCDATNLGDLLVRICHADAPPLAEHAPWVDPQLDAIVRRALAKRPEHRYASVEDLARALAPFARATPLDDAAFEPLPVLDVARPTAGAALRSTLAGSRPEPRATAAPDAPDARRSPPGRPRRAAAAVLLALTVAVGGAALAAALWHGATPPGPAAAVLVTTATFGSGVAPALPSPPSSEPVPAPPAAPIVTRVPRAATTPASEEPHATSSQRDAPSVRPARGAAHAARVADHAEPLAERTAAPPSALPDPSPPPVPAPPLNTAW